MSDARDEAERRWPISWSESLQRDFGGRLLSVKPCLQDAFVAGAEWARKQRTVTTADELDAMPEGALVLFPDGVAGQHVKSGLIGHVSGAYHRTDGTWVGGAHLTRMLPATILYDPREEQDG